ncbi:hypothetical protein [Paenibacillus kobensis]|uniref:hypothetical protein n=1 Tax=Paenibacillus kobensis TaxID=59841 RepID=UPI0013E4048E|nr:hypothetical protein [Paenibacillus kobensis]
MERERDDIEQAQAEQVKSGQPVQADADEEIGPADALPAWRPFYAAVRDAVRKLREQ